MNEIELKIEELEKKLSKSKNNVEKGELSCKIKELKQLLNASEKKEIKVKPQIDAPIRADHRDKSRNPIIGGNGHLNLMI